MHYWKSSALSKFCLLWIGLGDGNWLVGLFVWWRSKDSSDQFKGITNSETLWKYASLDSSRAFTRAYSIYSFKSPDIRKLCSHYFSRCDVRAEGKNQGLAKASKQNPKNGGKDQTKQVWRNANTRAHKWKKKRVCCQFHQGHCQSLKELAMSEERHGLLRVKGGGWRR